ncbi:MAG: energy transducer TonB [Acidobacteriota bacterium]
MRPYIYWMCFMLGLSLTATAQSGPPDSDPVLQGSASYSMPQQAIDAEIDGKVVMGIHLDESGTPTKAWLASGPAWPCGSTPMKAIEELSLSLTAAMMKLRFTPPVKGGKPVSRDIGLTLTLKNPYLGKKMPAPEIDPKTGKPKPRLVVGGVINGKATSLPAPAYPSAAKANRDHGGVTVEVLIDEQGNVIRAGALQGPATLQFASRDAACGAKFSPTRLSGNPVKVSGVIVYNFNL